MSYALRRIVLAASLLTFVLPAIMLWAAPPSHHAASAQKSKSGSSGASTQRLVLPDAKVSFMPPAGWERTSDVPPPTIAFIPPNAADETVNIGIVTERV